MTRARSWLELTKPGIAFFISISAAAGFVTAGVAIEPLRLLCLFAATLLMAGGAAAANQIIERESDAHMRRTAHRPLPSGRLTLRAAYAVSAAASLSGFVLAMLTLPVLATVLLVASHVSYVHIYTPLKRRTSLCTLVGAVPGSLPVLAGCAAAAGSLTPAGIALAGVLFTWQIPHFMAIGWLGRADYEGTGCPMLFVVDRSGLLSARIAVLYAFCMLLCAWFVALMAPPSGVLYLVVATAVGSAYITTAWRFLRVRERSSARQLFFTSLMALPLLLAAFAIDMLAI
jgi:heme o synthase